MKKTSRPLTYNTLSFLDFLAFSGLGQGKLHFGEKEGKGYAQKERGIIWYEKLLNVGDNERGVQGLKRTRDFVDCVHVFDPICHSLANL